MTRGGSLIGSFKSLFKTSKNSGNGTRTAPQGVPDSNELTSREPRLPAMELGTNTSALTVLSTSVGNDVSKSPFTSRKSLHRKLFAHTSGPLSMPAQSPLSATQAPLHHSLSDPCDDPANQFSSCKTNRNDCGSSLQHACRANVSQSSARILSARAAFTPAPRSDTALLTSCEIPSRCSSLDMQGVFAISGPAEVTVKVLPVVASPLSGVGERTCIRTPSPQVTSMTSSLDTTPVEAAPPPPPDTLLLALCPGTPSAMRRKNWCLEDYDVTRKIYKGSTSAVYKATCRRSGLPVALKVYFLSHVPSNVIHMIVREIKIHVELVHKNIVMLYSAFQDEKRLVLVQEYAGRGDLYGIFRAMNRRMSEAQLTSLVLAPFMDALSYLHAKGICHRDVKPENILFTNDWRLVIADFGVSIDLHQERAVTRAGTLEYMAPEVERCPLKMLPEENKENDSIAYGTAVDVWATGVLAYELLAGFPPFVVDHAAAAGANGAGGTFVATHATRKTLSFPSSTTADARDFISLALAERAEERPTSQQLCRHPWLAAATLVTPDCPAAATQQLPLRPSAGQLGCVSVTQMNLSRLGSAALASSAHNSGAVR